MSKLSLRLHADEEHWIPLSDLMTGLMFLFLIIAIAYMVTQHEQSQKTQQVLQSYSQSQSSLSTAMQAAIGKRMPAWGGTIDSNTLSIRFAGKTGYFKLGSAELEPQFKATLDAFFPKYLKILTDPRYRSDISELRIEGFTSSPGDYVANMQLSQARTLAVLQYVLALPAAQQERPWLSQVISADGFSSSHLVRGRSGLEDASLSQRVEFHVQMDADDKIRRALRAGETPAQPSQTPPPFDVQIINRPMPAGPDWGSGYVGKSLAQTFPKTNKNCAGYIDGPSIEYTGAPAGEKFFGWAYDREHNAAVDRLVVADASGRIVSAAFSGEMRPDVPQTLAWVKSVTSGWWTFVHSGVKGPISVWAVMSEPGTVCRITPAKQYADQVQ